MNKSSLVVETYGKKGFVGGMKGERVGKDRKSWQRVMMNGRKVASLPYNMN